MRAGELRWRLTFVRRQAAGTDDFGAPTPAWVEAATVWAKKTDVSDGEQVRAAAVGAKIEARFLARRSAASLAVRQQDRLRCDGELFDITGIKAVGLDGIEFSGARAADG